MWLFRREDPELRALRKQLKEAEEAKKRAEVEAAARIKQIEEEGRRWQKESEARSRAQQEEFIRQIEELAEKHGKSFEEVYELIMTQMQANLDHLQKSLTIESKTPGKKNPAASDN
jgi:hypothetical protein